MKKFFLLNALLYLSFISFSQEKLLSKNDKVILPEKSDFSLGLDASPFFNYLGNLFNDNETNTSNNIISKIPLSIIGRYFVRENRAIRVTVGVGFSNFSNELIVDDASQNDTTFKVTDETDDQYLSFLFGGGFEFRRGSGRLQAFYGPHFQISYTTSSTKFNYGNAIADVAPPGNPTSVVRLSEINEGAVIGVRLGGFIGVEYFFAPKISFSAELGFAVNYEEQGQGEKIYDTYERSTFIIIPVVSEEEISVKTAGSTLFEVDTQPNAGIALNFYF